MRIQILILVFKGLSGFDYCDTVEPPLSIFPQGTSKLPINGGWPLISGVTINQILD